MNGQHPPQMDNISRPHGRCIVLQSGIHLGVADGEDEHDLREEDSIMRLIRGLAALVVLVAGLVAVPVFLVVVVGNPLPSDLDGARLVGRLTRPDDGSILVGLVTIVAWIAWAVFAASVIVEIIAVLSRQRVRIRLPGLMASQRLASGLVVAVVALVVVTPQLSHASPARATPAPSHDDATRAAVAPVSDRRQGRLPRRTTRAGRLCRRRPAPGTRWSGVTISGRWPSGSTERGATGGRSPPRTRTS